MRQQLSENKSFSQILRDHGLRLNLALLVPFAWWHPPHGIARRFDTRFYVAAARDQQRDTARPDGGEAVAAFWASPADVLAAAERGERQIIFPTRCNLERMAAFPTFAALIAHARAQALVKVEAWVEERADGKWLCIPDNAGYPVTAMRLTAIRRG